MELRPPSYFTLAALIDGPLHGYAMMRRASELSGGAVTVSTGTLYSILDRALAEGLVVAGEPYVVSGRERRDYSLTPAGRLVLQEESERLARAARVVVRRLRATGGVPGGGRPPGPVAQRSQGLTEDAPRRRTADLHAIGLRPLGPVAAGPASHLTTTPWRG